jgi:hypothetical protein
MSQRVDRHEQAGGKNGVLSIVGEGCPRGAVSSPVVGGSTVLRPLHQLRIVRRPSWRARRTRRAHSADGVAEAEMPRGCPA